jgi:5'/3'-nucleotidase SurE
VQALITNDDGIASPGLRTLAAAAVAAGLDAVVAAPSWDSSGASASMTAVLNEIHPNAEPGTDAAGLAHGCACFTPLVAPCAAHATEVAGSRRSRRRLGAA